MGAGEQTTAGCSGDSAVLPAGVDSESASSSIRFSKACLKNVFSVLLIFIYLLLMAVAVFLVYQTITDFREKLKHPVMSVSYKEVDRYDAPGRACRAGHQHPGSGALLSKPCLPEPPLCSQPRQSGARWRLVVGMHLRASAGPWGTEWAGRSSPGARLC